MHMYTFYINVDFTGEFNLLCQKLVFLIILIKYQAGIGNTQ